MSIGIDINEILHGSRAIRRYCIYLVHEMAKMELQKDYKLFYFQFRKPHYPAPEVNGATRIRKVRVPFPGKYIVKAWEKWNFPDVQLFTGKLKLFHAPGTFVPPKGRYPLVITTHAMHHLYINELLEPKHRDWYVEFMDRCIRDGDYFVTVAESMKRDLIKFYNLDGTKIKAIPLGVSPEFQVRDKAEAQRKLKERFGIERSYMLYVGGLQKHKNVHGILEAYAKAKKRLKKLPLLVLTGDKSSSTKEIEELIPKLNLQSDVFFTGYVEQEAGELELLYNGADLFVFPTYWEGWSSPPLEAMASGVPVIASDIVPHQENLGDAAILVPPSDIEKLGESICRMIEDPACAEDYRKRGLEHIKPFTWDKMAKSTLDFYDDILNGKPQAS